MRVYKKRALRHPIDKKLVYGLVFGEEIWLNPKRKPVIPTLIILIHELVHVLFPNLSEGEAQTAAALLWQYFEMSQIRVLSKYIPRHFVKQQPDLWRV